MTASRPMSVLAASAVGAMVAIIFAGCAAVDIGEPKVDRNTRTVFDTVPSSTRIDVTATRMTYRADGGGSVTIGLEADVREVTPRTSHTETTTVTTQKRLAYGFFPAAAEEYCVPKGTPRSACLKHPYPACFILGLPFVPLGTASSLVFEPLFGSYDCSKGKQRDAYSHVGLIGFHKYTTTLREGPVRGPTVDAEPQVRTRSNVSVPGPFEVEFSIPDLNHRPAPVQTGRDGKASFRLPSVSRDRTVRVYVSFRQSRNSWNQDPITPKAIAKASTQTHYFDLTLRAPAPPPAPPRPQPVPPRPQPVPQPKPLYNVIGINPGENGAYSVRIEILDQSRTFDIRKIIEPEVRSIVREHFQSMNHGIPPQDVREFLDFRTESNGRYLVCTGWAFSVRPVKDGWSYDAESHRGWVRLRITGGMPAEDAKRWARENISAIVSEKNVAIEAWNAPPSGATWHSLSERYENGVLTVEFEAVK